jgi:hypothetical protein
LEHEQGHTASALTWIAAIGAVLAALFTGWQAWIAKDAEQRQLRAYVVVKSATFARDESGQLKLGRTFPDGRSELQIYYEVSNEGLTPAYDLFRRIDVEYPFAGTIPFNYTDGTAAYLTKEQTFGPVITRPFTKDEIAEILAGTDKPLVFAGQMTYRDIFGDIWPTNFCFMYAAHPSDVSFISCPRFSDIDRLNFAR